MYKLGILHAFKQLGLVKEGRVLLPALGALGGAGKGALVGSSIGGITGALSADEGQTWEGLKRGLRRGAITGAAVGGAGGLRRGITLSKELGSKSSKEILQSLVKQMKRGKLSLDDIKGIYAGGDNPFIVRSLAATSIGAITAPEGSRLEGAGLGALSGLAGGALKTVAPRIRKKLIRHLKKTV